MNIRIATCLTLLCSAGIHGLFLWLPLPVEPELQVSELPEEQITLVTLPKPKSQPNTEGEPKLAPKPTAKPDIKPETEDRATEQLERSPKPAAPEPDRPVKESPKSQEPEQVREVEPEGDRPTESPQERNAEQPTDPVETSDSEPTDPVEEETDISEEPNEETPKDVKSLLAGVEDAVQGNGCVTDCWQIRDKRRVEVANSLIERLREEGYTIDKRDDLEDTGISIYEVSKEGEEPQFLTIATDLDGNTIYALADRTLNKGDLIASGV